MVEQKGDSAGTGIVYILSNPAMEGYIKIGSTTDLRSRLKTLDSTGVPRAFVVEYAALVNNHELVEKELHTAFGDRRVRPNREFFEGVEPFRVRAVLKLLEIRDVTPGISQELAPDFTDIVQEKPIKAEKFRFSMVNIPVGASLKWADDIGKECFVADANNHVEYNGKQYTISGLARELKNWASAQGSRYWLYDGETLQERRERLEMEASGEDE